MSDTNTLRRLNWLWKNRHTHDGDTFQQQIDVIRTTIEQQADDISAAQYGAYLHAIADSQSITSGGTAIAFAFTFQWLPSYGAIEADYPTTDIRVGTRGYYNVDISLAWDTYVGGGAVSVVRVRAGVEVLVWPPAEVTDWDSDDSSEFVGQAPAIPCEPGDLLRVYLDADTTETLAGGAVAVYLVDHKEGESACVVASGGTESESGGYTYHVFTSSGTLEVSRPGAVEVLVVGGGGGGGGACAYATTGHSPPPAGGGGGGGVTYSPAYLVSTGSINVVVGAGGAGGYGASDANIDGANGSASSFDGSVTAAGGGGGAGHVTDNGSAGASGGGGTYNAGTGGTGSSGGDGGDGEAAADFAAGGGGGAGEDGEDGSVADGQPQGGIGELVAGFTSWGDSGYFGGGGGGGRYGSGVTSFASKSGGGGYGSINGADGSTQLQGHGLDGSGGGGGGARSQQFGLGYEGGDGGDGIVIVRYETC